MAATGNGLRSGELARLTGLSPDTIRHYEHVGVLPTPHRTAAGYRVYARDAVDRVLLVQRALQLGFTLAELSEILRVRDTGGVPCHRVLRMTEEKLRLLEHQIEELKQAQRYMRRLVRQWRLQLEQTKPGTKAMLLHSLIHKKVPSAKSATHFRRRKP